MGRCEPKTGIEPIGRLVNQVLSEEPYHSAERLFWIVDNGSSHRGEASKKRLHKIEARHKLFTDAQCSSEPVEPIACLQEAA